VVVCARREGHLVARLAHCRHCRLEDRVPVFARQRRGD
jgi:hypothetical protein